VATEYYGQPVLIPNDGDIQLLERVSLDGKDYDEKFVQTMAFDHPECLPVSAIDSAYENLVPVCMELYTPAGPLDALYVTPTGRLVVVEAKLWRNPESRRKVVGQILDYAQELSRWDYSDLQKEVSRKLNRKGNALYEIVRERYPETDEVTFNDGVQVSLRKGRFLLMILGDGIRQGAAAITNFLEKAGQLEFTFGLVELAIYRHPDNGLLLQPRVLAKTVEIGRTVLQLADGIEVEEQQFATEDDADPDPEAAERRDAVRRFYRSFWSDWLESLQLDDTEQPMPNMSKSANINFPMPPSRSGTYLKCYFSQVSNRVGVFIKLPRGNYGEAAFNALTDQQEEIEKELGEKLKWDASDGVPKIIHSKDFSDVTSDSERAAIQSYLSDMVNRFVNVFRPRLERIADEHSEG
jgi:hypothetical protein